MPLNQQESHPIGKMFFNYWNLLRQPGPTPQNGGDNNQSDASLMTNDPVHKPTSVSFCFLFP